MSPGDRQITKWSIVLRGRFSFGLLTAQQTIGPDINRPAVWTLHTLRARNHLFFANAGVTEYANVVGVILITLNTVYLFLCEGSYIEREKAPAVTEKRH